MNAQNWLCLLSAVASTLTAQSAMLPAPDDQEEPSVVANGNGYFVVWADKRSYGSTEYDIYGARVSSAGEVLDPGGIPICTRSEEHTSELQSHSDLVCRLLLEKKKKNEPR